MHKDRRKKRRHTCYYCGVGHVLDVTPTMAVGGCILLLHRSEVVGVGLVLDMAGVCCLLSLVSWPSSVIVGHLSSHRPSDCRPLSHCPSNHWPLSHHPSDCWPGHHCIVRLTIDHCHVVCPTIDHHRVVRLTIDHCCVVHPTVGHCHIVCLTIGHRCVICPT